MSKPKKLNVRLRQSDKPDQFFSLRKGDSFSLDNTIKIDFSGLDFENVSGIIKKLLFLK